MVLNFRDIFWGKRVENCNGARDDENATSRAGGYAAGRAVSREDMTYSATYSAITCEIHMASLT